MASTSSIRQAAPTTPVVLVATVAPPPATTLEVKMDARLLALARCGSLHDLESHLSGQASASINGAIGSSAKHFSESRFRTRSPLEATLFSMSSPPAVVIRRTSSTKHASSTARPQSLLFVQNSLGDTPMHRAARVGNFRMVSLLVDLVKGLGLNNATGLLETQNKIKQTALHEAVRSGNNGIVKLLMEENPQLARFPEGGTSPLYLAILLENKSIAKTLYELSGGDLSYSGPNGRNALHVAVQRSQGTDL